jgi:hypothetical protein
MGHENALIVRQSKPLALDSETLDSCRSRAMKARPQSDPVIPSTLGLWRGAAAGNRVQCLQKRKLGSKRG